MKKLNKSEFSPDAQKIIERIARQKGVTESDVLLNVENLLLDKKVVYHSSASTARSSFFSS